MSGEYFLQSLKEGQWSGHISERPILMERLEIKPSRDAVNLKNRFDLGGEQQPIGLSSYVKRFFPQPITRKDEATMRFVPQREREHPSKLFNERQSSFLVQMDNYFRV